MSAVTVVHANQQKVASTLHVPPHQHHPCSPQAAGRVLLLPPRSCLCALGCMFRIFSADTAITKCLPSGSFLFPNKDLFSLLADKWAVAFVLVVPELKTSAFCHGMGTGSSGCGVWGQPPQFSHRFPICWVL